MQQSPWKKPCTRWTCSSGLTWKINNVFAVVFRVLGYKEHYGIGEPCMHSALSTAYLLASNPPEAQEPTFICLYSQSRPFSGWMSWFISLVGQH